MGFGGMALMMLLLIGGVIWWIASQANVVKREKEQRERMMGTGTSADGRTYQERMMGLPAGSLGTPAFVAPPKPGFVQTPAPMAAPLKPATPAPMGAAVQITGGVSVPGAPFCPTCGAVAVWVGDKNAFGCERCQRMLA